MMPTTPPEARTFENDDLQSILADHADVLSIRSKNLESAYDAITANTREQMDRVSKICTQAIELSTQARNERARALAQRKG